MTLATLLTLAPHARTAEPEFNILPAILGGGFGLIFAVLVVAGMWTTLVKAGKPGWAAIVPIYNIIMLLEVCGRPWWWVFLFFIPCVGIIVSIIFHIDLAKSFGKDAIYGVGLVFLAFIFYPLLGFGDARYMGPAAAPTR